MGGIRSPFVLEPTDRWIQNSEFQKIVCRYDFYETSPAHPVRAVSWERKFCVPHTEWLDPPYIYIASVHVRVCLLSSINYSATRNLESSTFCADHLDSRL